MEKIVFLNIRFEFSTQIAAVLVNN